MMLFDSAGYDDASFAVDAALELAARDDWERVPALAGAADSAVRATPFREDGARVTALAADVGRAVADGDGDDARAALCEMQAAVERLHGLVTGAESGVPLA